MEVLLILVVGVVVGGFHNLSVRPQDTGRFAWLVDAATDLSELEKNLNRLSEQGFGVIVSFRRRLERSNRPS